MLELLATLVAWIATVAAALAVGRPLARWLRLVGDDLFADLVWSVALGLLAWGVLLTTLGLSGLLYPVVVCVLTACAACWGLGETVGVLLAQRIRRQEERDARALLLVAPMPGSTGSSPPRWLHAGIAVLAAIALGASFLSALAPPTAGDALCYHLDLPKRFLAEHRIGDLPYNDNATYPLLVEMWYAWGLALDGGVAAQLMHWTLGALLVGATVLLARPVLGRDWAWLAGALALLVPGITNQMTAPLNDAALATLTTLALVAWRAGCARAREGEVDAHSTERTPHTNFAAAGVLFGAALSTKYVAILFVVAVGAVWLYDVSRRRAAHGQLLRGAIVTLALAVVVAGIWYGRALWLRGDLVYPFLSDTGASADKTLLEMSIASMVSAPWLVTLHPEQFGGRGHELGPLFLAMLPGLVFARRLRGLAPLLAIAAVYGALWFALRQNVRFLYPVVPLLAVGCVWLVAELQRMPNMPRRLAVGVVAMMLLAGAFWPVYRVRDKFQVAIGLESREAFLLRTEPTYRAAAIANRLVPPDGHLLSQDYRGFYFDAPVTREALYRRETHYDAALADQGQRASISHELRRRGFTHVLVATASGPSGIRYEPTLARLIEAERRSAGEEALARLADYEFLDSDGARRRYQLFLLR